LQIIVDILPRLDHLATVVELCRDEGLLTEANLKRFPTYTVHGLDGSTEMHWHAQERLARFSECFQTWPFDLATRSWRDVNEPAHAIVRSLRSVI